MQETFFQKKKLYPVTQADVLHQYSSFIGQSLAYIVQTMQ